MDLHFYRIILILISSVEVKTKNCEERFAIKRLKQQRNFSSCVKRLALCGVFAVFAAGAYSLVSFFASALADPIRSVDITSQNKSFESYESGAWKVTKSAKWIAKGKARITLTIDSIAKDDERPKDILLVLDNSGSMLGRRLEQAKQDITSLVTTLMTERDARFGLITFNSTSTLVHNLTDDRQAIVDSINNLGVYGQTNYYEAILNMEQIFANYDFTEGRRPIVLFMTDGEPTVDAPLQISEYQLFKTLYPDVSVRGIQYEMGDEIRQRVKDISDLQWRAEMDDLNDTLWRAISEDSFLYDTFRVEDYIDDTYYTIDSAASIKASLGSYSLTYDGTTPKVTWDLNGLYRSGTKEALSIDVNIRDQYYADDDGRYPTNKHIDVRSSIYDTPDENISSTKTPILKLKYTVTKNNNVPDSSCQAHESTEKYIVFDPVDMDYETGEWCNSYYTNGWDLGNEEIIRMGSDYFLMPEEDVDLKAVWRKVTIDKSMDGEVYTTPTAFLERGEVMNVRIKNLVPGANATSHYLDHDTTIKAFKRATTKPDDFDTRNKVEISRDASPFPIYAYLGNDGETVYYWSDAEVIYLYPNSRSMFESYDVLEDISGLSEFNATSATTMGWMFKHCHNLSDLSPISDWDVTNVYEMAGMFDDATSLTDVDALADWRTPILNDVESMFNGTSNLTSIAGLLDWGVTEITSIGDLLRDAVKLTTLHGLENWGVSNVTNANNAFWGCHTLTDITALTDWVTTSFDRMEYMFKDNYALVNINPLTGWTVDNVKSFEGVFSFAQSITNLDALADWNVSNGENFAAMFDHTHSLIDISGLADWRPTNAQTMFGMFYDAQSLTSASGLKDWDIDNVTVLSDFFRDCFSLTDIADLAGWADNLESVEAIGSFFSDDKELVNISALTDWVMPNVADMSAVFRGTKKIADYNPISGWNTSKVTDMEAMFGWSNMSDLNAIRNWDVSKVETMKFLFHNCPQITTLEPIENWNVVSLKDINGIFRYLENVTTLEPMRAWGAKLSNHLIDTQYAFEGMTSVTDISPFSTWDVSNVTSLAGMFGGIHMTNLSALSGWNVSNVTDFSNMFQYCKFLTTALDIESWAPMIQDQANFEEMFLEVPLDRSLLPSWYEE